MKLDENLIFDESFKTNQLQSSSSSASTSSYSLSSSPNILFHEQKLNPTTDSFLVTMPSFIITTKESSKKGLYTVACFAHSNTNWFMEMNKFILNLYPKYPPSTSNKVSPVKQVSHCVTTKFETNNFEIHVLQGDEKAKKQEIITLKPSIILVFDSNTKGWESFMESKVRQPFTLSVPYVLAGSLCLNPFKTSTILPESIQVGSSKAREYGNLLLTEATQFMQVVTPSNEEDSMKCLIC